MFTTITYFLYKNRFEAQQILHFYKGPFLSICFVNDINYLQVILSCRDQDFMSSAEGTSPLPSSL